MIYLRKIIVFTLLSWSNLAASVVVVDAKMTVEDFVAKSRPQLFKVNDRIRFKFGNEGDSLHFTALLADAHKRYPWHRAVVDNSSNENLLKYREYVIFYLEIQNGNPYLEGKEWESPKVDGKKCFVIRLRGGDVFYEYKEALESLFIECEGRIIASVDSFQPSLPKEK